MEQPSQSQDPCKVIKELSTRGNSRRRTSLRVASWNGRPPVLEKRQVVYDDVKGREVSGRVRGLNPWEIVEIVTRKDEILDLLSPHYPNFQEMPNGQD